MATYGGTYKIGQSTFDIDPAWTNVLYGPLGISDFSDGFRFGQNTGGGIPSSVPAPQEPAPSVNNKIDTIGVQGRGDKASGGLTGTRATYGGYTTTEPFSGDNDIDFDNSSWWGGLYDPDVSVKDALKQYGPVLAQGLKSPLGTVLKSMKLDPMKDKLLQDQLSAYLGQVNSELTLDDIISAYNTLVSENQNIDMNREDTIQGLALSAHPQYRDAVDAAINAGWDMNDIGAWSQAVGEYNATHPESDLNIGDMIDPRTAAWDVPELSPMARVLDQYRTFQGPGGDVLGHVMEGYDPMGLTNRVTDIVNDYGYASWSDFANGIRSDNVNGDMGYTSDGVGYSRVTGGPGRTGAQTGAMADPGVSAPSGSDRARANEVSASDVAAAKAAAAAAQGKGGSSSSTSGGMAPSGSTAPSGSDRAAANSPGMAAAKSKNEGKGNSAGGSGSKGGGKSDGDSSNNGNGAHD